MLVNIVAELKGLPNTTMTQTWKDRVQAYLSTQELGEKAAAVSAPLELSTVKDEDAILGNESSESSVDVRPSAGSPKPMTLRFTEEGHPLGVLDTLVQSEFEGDVFAFLDYLERELQTPDFTAGTFARKHGVMEGKRTLQRIVAQLKGESAHSSQMWKDRVQAYMQYKAESNGGIIQGPPVQASDLAPLDMMESTVTTVHDEVVKENVTLHGETLLECNQAAV